MSWPVHPAASLFPMLDDERLSELAEDIEKNGLIESLWLWADQNGETFLLDGRNRLAACELAGVEPTTKVYEGPDPIGFVLSQNLHRRHLTTGQRAAVGASIRELRAVEAKARQGARTDLHHDIHEKSRESSGREGWSSAQAGREVGVSEWAVDKYRLVEKEEPSLAGQVKAGNITLNAAYREVKNRKEGAPPSNQNKPRLMPIAPSGQIVQNVGNSLHAAVAALEKIDVTRVNEVEVAEWISDLEAPLRQIRKTIRAWKERDLCAS